jgi:hypothetical protein
MTTRQLSLTIAVLVWFAGNLIAAPSGTAFTYQGKLTEGGNVATGSYDLKFSLYDALSSGS